MIGEVASENELTAENAAVMPAMRAVMLHISCDVAVMTSEPGVVTFVVDTTAKAGNTEHANELVASGTSKGRTLIKTLNEVARLYALRACTTIAIDDVPSVDALKGGGEPAALDAVRAPPAASIATRSQSVDTPGALVTDAIE